MTTSIELLVDGFGRIRGAVRRVVRGLTPEELAVRVDDGANSIGWLIWHLTRVQDDHVAEVADSDQVWTDAGWFERFGLPFPAEVTGFGQSANEVAQVAGITAELLVGYHEAVHDRTVQFIEGLSDRDFEPDRRHQLGPAGHARRAAGQCDRRRPAARRSGRVRGRDAGPPLSDAN